MTVLMMEGPDRCGKTEIGAYIADQFDAPYFKVSSEADNWRKPGGFKTALEYDQTYISEFLEQTQASCTIDRAYPSEWVYSRVFKRDTNNRLTSKIDATFARIGAVILLCTRHNAPMEWDDELVSRTKFQQIKEMYDRFFEWTACSIVKMHVDDYDCNIQKQLPVLEEAINSCRNSRGTVKIEL